MDEADSDADFARKSHEVRPFRSKEKQLREGLVFKARRLLYHSTLSRPSVIKKKKKKQTRTLFLPERRTRSGPFVLGVAWLLPSEEASTWKVSRNSPEI